MRSTLRLFNALPIGNGRGINHAGNPLIRTIPKGYILSWEVASSYRNLGEIMDTVESELGLSPEQMNATLHKSWGKVANASMTQLVVEQVLHYITTYGFQSLGIYSDDTVYIPYEKLEIPELTVGNLRLTVIHGYTKEELKVKLMELLETGIALHEDTIKDVVEVATFVGLASKDIEKIKNREVATALYGILGGYPSDPVEFLRYMVFRSTETTLLIKNDNLIERIKNGHNTEVTMLFRNYLKTHGVEPLASIFNRYKPLFLAFKCNTTMNSIINKISKASKTAHKPLPVDYLNDVTRQISNDELDMIEYVTKLQGANIFRKIRLAYALKFRSGNPDSIVYRVRNGKSYSAPFEYANKKGAIKAYGLAISSLAYDLYQKLNGKKIYIPEGVTYALPATEKMFTGNLPSGTSITVPKNMVFGVHWKNVNGKRTDLDLSLMNANIGKIGWDSSYRTGQRNILFSGDLTNASGKGASELFYVSNVGYGNYIMHVNYYNFVKDTPVPISIVVGKNEGLPVKMALGRDYMLDPNKVKIVAKSKVDKKQTVLGLITTENDSATFYFVQADLGGGITSRSNERTEQARKYLFNYYQNTISLNDMLIKAGAVMVDNPEDADIDLSPETIDKATIINLIS